jgi:hypothetical protein
MGIGVGGGTAVYAGRPASRLPICASAHIRRDTRQLQIARYKSANALAHEGTTQGLTGDSGQNGLESRVSQGLFILEQPKNKGPQLRAFVLLPLSRAA